MPGSLDPENEQIRNDESNLELSLSTVLKALSASKGNSGKPKDRGNRQDAKNAKNGMGRMSTWEQRRHGNDESPLFCTL